LSLPGAFVRAPPHFTAKVEANSPTGLVPERDRYHLYLSLACPWSHKILIMRNLKGLQKAIGVTIVDWWRDDKGWRFCDDKPGCSLDPTSNHFKYLSEVYLLSDPSYAGRWTVPVLFDKKTNRIVSNEYKWEIMRMLNSQFNEFCATQRQAALDFYPKHLHSVINETNGWVHDCINDGVYKCGFATGQDAYEHAFNLLFNAMDRVEAILSKQRYICSNEQLTETDLSLFVTLVRFDAVYFTLFKCNLHMLMEYPNTYAHVRELYQMDDIGETVNMLHIKNHYFQTLSSINPYSIVPLGPFVGFQAPHGRDRSKTLEEMEEIERQLSSQSFSSIISLIPESSTLDRLNSIDE